MTCNEPDLRAVAPNPETGMSADPTFLELSPIDPMASCNGSCAECT